MIMDCSPAFGDVLSALIRDSASLQYGVEKQLACVEDTANSRRTNSLLSRANHLHLLQHAWLNFTYTHVRTLTIDCDVADANFHNLVSDVYALDGAPGPVLGLSTEIVYTRIPMPSDCGDTSPAWEHLAIGQPVADFFAAIDDYNLIAVATCKSVLSVDIRLLDFSTGKPHDLAKMPVIRVHEFENTRSVPITGMTVAGEHVLLTTIYDGDTTDLNMLHVFNWKTGITVGMVSTSDVEATFLAEDLILLSNRKGNSLDIYHVSPDSEAEMVHSVSLPPLMPSYSVTSLACNSSPNCLGSISRSRRRYTSDFEKSLLVVSFRIAPGGYEDEEEEFLFVFLRNDFMDMLQNRRKAGHAFTRWPLWGPELTRWLNVATTSDHMSYGRRFAWIPQSANNTPQPIHVLDFNPTAAALTQKCNHSLTATSRTVTHREVTIIRSPAFQTPVTSTLPYVETVSRAKFTYHCVEIHEDNILGCSLKFTDSDAFRSIDILHIGEISSCHPEATEALKNPVGDE
ncbi:hypothetical protein C8R47DRAFT_1267689 [Mycena vitilis]|nr:hypothetical protein C8R47DRAFT_1267689 [Mycena vitilis]